MPKGTLIISEKVVSRDTFWNAVFLYQSLPHVVNRRILSVSQLFILKVNFTHDLYTVRDVLTYTKLDAVVCELKSIESKNINVSIITNLFDKYKNKFIYKEVDFDEVKKSENGTFISVRILFPRNVSCAKCLEFIIIEKENNITTFIETPGESKKFIGPKIQYNIELDKADLLKICVLDTEIEEKQKSEWLIDTLFPKLMSWTDEKNVNKTFTKSLCLIPEEKYCLLYHELKLKYGENIVKNWTENTDPQKFVYEDIAIATYLILLWERTCTNKQKFVDLGCGNGLLVHILSQEGHDGIGIDIRARKIWKMFPTTTKLKVETIVPSSKFVYPDANWIIGNHSDELSPWIPVIAARSSETCNYFLLPCCSYEFNGKKYQRNNTSISQYQDFLEYLQTISNICGFQTEVDRLRIPSTKRICLVGARRQYTDFADVNTKITNFINNRIGIQSSEADEWVENYKTRPAVEKVRNCTKLNKELIDSIVKKVFMYLLSHDNYVRTSLGKNWNIGGKVSLLDLVNILSSAEMKEMKSECGGLKTLLRNHHYIFDVAKQDVQIRIPSTNVNKKNVMKIRDCWFHKNHPDGCPLDDTTCNFIHC